MPQGRDVLCTEQVCNEQVGNRLALRLHRRQQLENLASPQGRQEVDLLSQRHLMARTDKQLKEFLVLVDEDIVIADGLAYAFVGLTRSQGNIVAVYSTNLIVDELMKKDMMDLETAEEYVQFNIADAYVGERTPLFVDFVPPFIWEDDEQ